MEKKFRKGDKVKLNWKFAERQRLLKPFIKKYGNPVLVHSTPYTNIFEKILTEGKLRVPKSRRLAHVEKILKIDNGIFFSLGFVYAIDYDFKYSLLFDLNLLKNLTYYRQSVSYMCYRKIVDYWDEHEPQQLVKLAKINDACKAVVHKYYTQEYEGETKKMFDFWKVEKEVYNLIKKDKNRDKLLAIIRRTAKKYYFSYPNSRRIAKKDGFTNRCPEIISKKEISIVNNPQFLGFYIKGEIPRDIQSILSKKYAGKILFDGRKIIKLDEI